MRDAALEDLLKQADALPFVMLVRWLEQLSPDTPRVGGDGPYRDERVRLHGAPELAFAASDVATVHADTEQVALTLAFGSLVGAGSPLPAGMIEGLACEDDDSIAERAFFDLFQHRLLGLSYRGLLKFDLGRSFFAPTPPPALDWMLALAGVTRERAPSGLPRDLLLRVLPLLLLQTASALRLQTAIHIVLEELGVHAVAAVREWQGGLCTLEERFRARLGRDLVLGRCATLGARVPAPASKIVLEIGPLTPVQCMALAPAGQPHAWLRATIELFCPETIDVALALHVAEHEPGRLGVVRLGHAAWLGRGRSTPLRLELAREDT